MKENEDFMDYEKNIMEKVDYYANFNNIDEIRDAVNSEFKGYGEASILLKAFEVISKLENDEELVEINNIFKLSGRYFLNDDFNINNFDNNGYNNFCYWDNSAISLSSLFYKIDSNDVNLFKASLEKSIEELKNNNSLESCMYKYFKKNIKIIEKMDVSGFLSTEGYFFSI